MKYVQPIDGEEALCISKPFVPDVAIFDLGMPRMDQARTKAAGFDYHSLKPASLKKLNAVLATLIQARDEKR